MPTQQVALANTTRYVGKCGTSRWRTQRVAIGGLLHDGVKVDVFGLVVILFDEEFAPSWIFVIGFGIPRYIERAPCAIHLREGAQLAFWRGCREAVNGDEGRAT